MATSGPILFSKQNPKMAVLRVIRGQNGMKLGKIDPWPFRGFPVTLLDFWPPESYSSAGWAEMEIFTLRIYYLNISRSFVHGNIMGRKRIY